MQSRKHSPFEKWGTEGDLIPFQPPCRLVERLKATPLIRGSPRWVEPAQPIDSDAYRRKLALENQALR